jgi:hypothetical protein
MNAFSAGVASHIGEKRLVLSIRMVGSSLSDEFEIQNIPYKYNCGESGDKM